MVELKQLYKRSSSHPRTDIQTVREKIGSKMELFRSLKKREEILALCASNPEATVAYIESLDSQIGEEIKSR
jgi:hypothetical protein